MRAVRVSHRRVLVLAALLVALVLLGYMYTSLGVFSRLTRAVRFTALVARTFPLFHRLPSFLQSDAPVKC
jgi:hypothetical protein